MQPVKQFAWLCFVLSLVVSTAISQERPARPRASDFNVEVLNLDRRNHIFAIPGSPARSSYFTHLDLKRVPDWKAADGVLAEVGALRLNFWLEEGLPWIEVVAVLGKLEPHSRPDEWNKAATAIVVSRALQPEETITIVEAARFGILPFQVRAFRAQPWSVGPPEVTNKTQALTVTRVTEDRPGYTLNVRNLSHKYINAIHWYGQENGRSRGGSGLSGARVIPPGGTTLISLHFGFPEEKLSPDATEREAASTREIVIAAIVFDDGTFEGEPDKAAEMAAEMAGSRIQLLRVNKLLRSEMPPNGHAQALKNLKRDIGALSEEVDLGVADELSGRFAAASEDIRTRRIKEEIKNGLRFVKGELLREIEKFEYRRDNSPAVADFDGWLKELIEKYGRMVTD
ncbi:MAG: hypothetical protein ACR2LM_15590 [Pyrinomonadaceae bacterium]